MALRREWDKYNQIPESERDQVGVVIDGKTLEFILAERPLKMSFLELGKRSKAVVCCRVTPKQKADVTRLIRVSLNYFFFNKKKTKQTHNCALLQVCYCYCLFVCLFVFSAILFNETGVCIQDNENRICLAIGDGANDVAMIQAAHVGIGISGKEGLQAVQSSDYAITQFRFLKKLLMIHGHWNYRRISRVITYNFYKNIVLYMTQFWFSLYNMVSGQSLYESWTQSTFNVFFTVLPIIAYGALDQDVPARGIYTWPSIYQVGQKKKLFNARMFAYWLCNAIWHSVVCFLIPLFLFLYVVAKDGQDRGLYGMGMFTYTGVVYVCCFKVFLMTRRHNIMTVMSIVLSIFAWFLWLLVYSYVILQDSQLVIWRLGYYVMELPSWWLCTFLVPVAALSRDLAWRG
jgi:phospholipid-transporting ATPase